MKFIKLKEAVAKQFNSMKGYDLFRTNVTKDELQDTYLSSFPIGSNPIFRERTEHDCNCCKQFIRAIGNIVAVVDGKLVSIWDGKVDDANYQVVTDAMSTLVKSKPIDNVFLHTENTAGTDKTYEDIVGGAKTWNHFFVNIPSNFVSRDIGTALSESRALHDVLLRSLTEITDDAVGTVLDLISQNSLYRGEEHRHVVDTFKGLKREFSGLSEDARDNFVWSEIKTVPVSVSKIRNTSIGTLLTDLSEGVDLEIAVKSFESNVAPMNYKRPTALVTKAMIESAKNKIEELGSTSALERRYATVSDIGINDAIFADRSVKQSMNGNIFDEISSTIADKKPKNLSKVDEISIEKFIADIVPNASSIEVMVDNEHIKNLVSLIAPVDITAAKLFKWDNNFSWSYNGDVADSIKERVKKAGGSVTGDLCCRLAWFNFDDLDFHMIEPGGYEIYFSNRERTSPCGGRLDVDMNAGSGKSREAVENIYYESCGKNEGRHLQTQCSQLCETRKH